MSNSVEWLIEKCACADLKPELWEIIKQQAREMHKKEMSYADGYAEGYNRAIELTKWAISNLIPPHNEHIVDANKIIEEGEQAIINYNKMEEESEMDNYNEMKDEQ
jgi:hypothetical protein